MALNLGETLRDAVDGPLPGLDDVVGEDPADLDLPALSARIRHRRRARAATRSAVGVAAAGAVALVGVHGLGGRGAQTVAEPPAVAVGPLCGTDVASRPVLDGDVRLVPANVAVIPDGAGGYGLNRSGTDLGTLVGRTLTVDLLQDQAADAAMAGTVVLTQGSTVVAAGNLLRQGASVTIDASHGTAVATRVTAVSSDLAPCPTKDGTPSAVPSGTYAVQLLVPATTGAGTDRALERSSAGPWLVTLLDPPPAVDLPAGYPADEVPVIGGKLESATRLSNDRWRVRVVVDGDDGVARAEDALRDAGGVTAGFLSSGYALTVDGQDTALDDSSRLLQLDLRQQSLTAEVAQAQQAYDALVAAGAEPDSVSWAARVLGQLQVQLQDAQTQRDQVLAGQAGTTSPPASYTLSGQGAVTVTTRSWSVEVTPSTADGRTVLTYDLTRR